MWTQLLSLAAAAVVALSSSAGAQFAGELTTYGPIPVMSGNCNFMSAAPDAAKNIAAINGAQWDATRNCGRCALVSCSDARCRDQNATQLVYIIDQCPGCKAGDLDVSPNVFRTVTGNSPGRYKTKWSFTKCPVPGNVQYCLKTGSNPHWIAVQPTNFAVGIKSVTINAKPTTMVPSAFYYLTTSSTPVDLKKVTVSVTSIGGQTITETVSLTAGSCTTGTKQFTA